MPTTTNTFIINPEPGHPIAASQFPPIVGDGVLYSGVTFSDTGTPFTDSNTVKATVAWIPDSSYDGTGSPIDLPWPSVVLEEGAPFFAILKVHAGVLDGDVIVTPEFTITNLSDNLFANPISADSSSITSYIVSGVVPQDEEVNICSIVFNEKLDSTGGSMETIAPNNVGYMLQSSLGGSPGDAEGTGFSFSQNLSEQSEQPFYLTFDVKYNTSSDLDLQEGHVLMVQPEYQTVVYGFINNQEEGDGTFLYTNVSNDTLLDVSFPGNERSVTLQAKNFSTVGSYINSFSDFNINGWGFTNPDPLPTVSMTGSGNVKTFTFDLPENEYETASDRTFRIYAKNHLQNVASIDIKQRTGAFFEVTSAWSASSYMAPQGYGQEHPNTGSGADLESSALPPCRYAGHDEIEVDGISIPGLRVRIYQGGDSDISSIITPSAADQGVVFNNSTGNYETGASATTPQIVKILIQDNDGSYVNSLFLPQEEQWLTFAKPENNVSWYYGLGTIFTDNQFEYFVYFNVKERTDTSSAIRTAKIIINSTYGSLEETEEIIVKQTSRFSGSLFFKEDPDQETLADGTPVYDSNGVSLGSEFNLPSPGSNTFPGHYILLKATQANTPGAFTWGSSLPFAGHDGDEGVYNAETARQVNMPSGSQVTPVVKGSAANNGSMGPELIQPLYNDYGIDGELPLYQPATYQDDPFLAGSAYDYYVKVPYVQNDAGSYDLYLYGEEEFVQGEKKYTISASPGYNINSLGATDTVTLKQASPPTAFFSYNNSDGTNSDAWYVGATLAESYFGYDSWPTTSDYADVVFENPFYLSFQGAIKNNDTSEATCELIGRWKLALASSPESPPSSAYAADFTLGGDTSMYIFPDGYQEGGYRKVGSSGLTMEKTTIFANLPPDDQGFVSEQVKAVFGSLGYNSDTYPVFYLIGVKPQGFEDYTDTMWVRHEPFFTLQADIGGVETGWGSPGGILKGVLQLNRINNTLGIGNIQHGYKWIEFDLDEANWIESNQYGLDGDIYDFIIDRNYASTSVGYGGSKSITEYNFFQHEEEVSFGFTTQTTYHVSTFNDYPSVPLNCMIIPINYFGPDKPLVENVIHLQATEDFYGELEGGDGWSTQSNFNSMVAVTSGLSTPVIVDPDETVTYTANGSTDLTFTNPYATPVVLITKKSPGEFTNTRAVMFQLTPVGLSNSTGQVPTGLNEAITSIGGNAISGPRTNALNVVCRVQIQDLPF